MLAGSQNTDCEFRGMDCGESAYLVVRFGGKE